MLINLTLVDLEIIVDTLVKSTAIVGRYSYTKESRDEVADKITRAMNDHHTYTKPPKKG